jgi:AhpC/TSA family
MHRLFVGLVVAGIFLAQPFSTAAAKEEATASAMPKVGDLAPEFALKYFDGTWPPKEVKLSDYRGKKQVVLAFYVFAFTGG